jgi:hypothetical protein
MTLVDDHLSDVVDRLFSRKTMDHRSIDQAGHVSPAAADLARPKP